MTELEKIVEKFKLRVFEVVPGLPEEGSFLLRFDFSAIDDSERPFTAGSTAIAFSPDESPKDFSDKLRKVADNLDEYWARAFPTTQ